MKTLFSCHHLFEAKKPETEPCPRHKITAYKMGLGGSGEPTVPHLNPKALFSLNIAERSIHDTRDKVREETERAVEIFL